MKDGSARRTHSHRVFLGRGPNGRKVRAVSRPPTLGITGCFLGFIDANTPADLDVHMHGCETFVTTLRLQERDAYHETGQGATVIGDAPSV